ncbi:MAG TPA: DUF4136 domain-containing protein [Thermoanaerobaculia bacterium]|jgi:hypothetical protein|nr:DUF4136 domain-containing protein [Thermoanaerobaculia bacterium]
MTSRRSTVFALVSAAALVGAACTSAPHMKTDFDLKADLSKARTFAVDDGRLFSKSVSPDKSRQEIASQFKDAVTRQLAAKGLTPSADHPDVLVTFIAGADNPTQVESLGAAGTHFVADGHFKSAWNSWWIFKHPEGTFLIDVVDPSTKALLYRAYAEADVEGAGGKALLEKSVAKAFEEFPPKV